MRYFTAYVKRGKGVKEAGKFSTRQGTPGSIAKKALTSACRKSKAKVCRRAILVREHGDNAVKEYTGRVRTLKRGKRVKIGDQFVTFRRKSSVKYVKTMRV